MGENLVFGSKGIVFENVGLAWTVAVQGEFSAIEVRRRGYGFVPVHLKVDHVNLAFLQVI